MPVYQGERFVASAIQSALRQTYREGGYFTCIKASIAGESFANGRHIALPYTMPRCAGSSAMPQPIVRGSVELKIENICGYFT